MAYTMDTTLKNLLKDPKVKPILDQYIPGVSNSPMLPMVEGMTLKQIVDNPMAAQLGITKDKVQTVLDQVNQVV
jgi:hypothetical protein